MTRITPELLAACLSDVETGRLGPEQCVAAHPAEAEGLQQLLEIARAIPAAPPVVPDSAFRLRARVALVEAMAAGSEPRVPFFTPWWAGRRGLSGLARAPIPAFALALALVLSTTGAGAAYAAQDALPGDPLYPVKISLDEVQLAFALDDEARAGAQVARAARRTEEIQKAVEAARPAAAEEASRSFVAAVEQADRHLAWASAAGKQVAGLEARLSEDLGRMHPRLAAAGAAAETRSAITAAAQAAQAGLGSKKAGAPRQVSDQKGQSAFEGNGAAKAADAAAAAEIEDLKGEIERIGEQGGVPGQSFQGLMSHLRAAEAALGRGQHQVAARNLEAFLNQLNAFQQSGHISPADYNALHQSYQALEASLQGASATPPPRDAGGGPASGGAGGAGNRPVSPPGRR